MLNVLMMTIFDIMKKQLVQIRSNEHELVNGVYEVLYQFNRNIPFEVWKVNS